MELSIIIPTYNEEQNIVKLIQYLRENLNPENIAEIIVSDGDSEDATCEIAEEFGVSVIHGAEKGRAIQMNYGAKKASGDILYFLHADSFPPKDFDSLILQEVRRGSEAGCFKMKFDSKSKWLNFWAWFTRFKANICRGGDQSLFVTKTLFNKIGGYKNQTIMEDTEIIPRLKKQTNFVVIPSNIVTSARRYEENGQYKLQFLFGIIHLLSRLGFSQQWLLKFYKNNIV